MPNEGPDLNDVPLGKVDRERVDNLVKFYRELKELGSENKLAKRLADTVDLFMDTYVESTPPERFRREIQDYINGEEFGFHLRREDIEFDLQLPPH